MENSAYEALITGVNVSIFIIATTIAILLFTTVIDLSDLANTSVKKGESGSVIVDGAQIENRIVTGSELLGYYTNYEKNKTNMQKQKDILKVWQSATVQTDLLAYIEAQAINKTFINKKFEIILLNIDAVTKKETYAFKAV